MTAGEKGWKTPETWEGPERVGSLPTRTRRDGWETRPLTKVLWRATPWKDGSVRWVITTARLDKQPEALAGENRAEQQTTESAWEDAN